MQLPDEFVEFSYSGLVQSPLPEGWTPLAELRNQHLLTSERIEAIKPLLQNMRMQIASEREMLDPPAKSRPLEAGFIDYPQKLLDALRRKGEASELGRIMATTTRLRSAVDRVVILGVGGTSLAARALFQSLCHSHHNELSEKMRMGKPRIYFEGDNFDNDTLHELMELLENLCVDPELPQERWGLVVISKSGDTLETSAVYRILRAELARYYTGEPDRFRKYVIPVTGSSGKLRSLCLADGFPEEEILSIPDNIGTRFGVFTAAGLVPAALMGLDVRALLLGAAAMTRRFFEEPFERNPVLQFAAVNHLMTEEVGKRNRVLAVWSKKLQSLGDWYGQLVAGSLGKMGRGATPVTLVATQDIHAQAQQLLEGARHPLVNHLVVRSTRQSPIPLGMADRNEDDLNSLSRRNFPELLEAARRGMLQSAQEGARPSTELLLPSLSEHVIGQLMQMMMLSTVIESKLMGVNPYSQPAVDGWKKHMFRVLKGG